MIHRTKTILYSPHTSEYKKGGVSAVIKDLHFIVAFLLSNSVPNAYLWELLLNCWDYFVNSSRTIDQCFRFTKPRYKAKMGQQRRKNKRDALAEPTIFFCSFSLHPINQMRVSSEILDQELYSSCIYENTLRRSIKLNWLSKLSKVVASCSLSFS